MYTNFAFNLQSEESRRRLLGLPELNETKRFLPVEDSLMQVENEGRAYVTRLIVSKDDLPRIVGIGGQILSAIKEKTGGHIRIDDLPTSLDEKMIVLGGYLRQVIDAFDLIAERLFISQLAYAAPPLCSVSLLIEDIKAGKIVGPKAATIQAIKTKAGATQIRMLKPTLEIGTTLYRSLIIEGNLLAISRAHFLIHELFSEPPSKTPSNAVSVSAHSLEQSIKLLAQRNVPYEAALKYQELHQYFKQFGLCLLAAPFPSPSPTEHPGNIFSLDSAIFESGKEQKCEFPIPKENAGFIIGKGGETLKALEEEFKLHIHVEKIPTLDNKRVVVIIGENIELIYRAREKILQMAGHTVC